MQSRGFARCGLNGLMAHWPKLRIVRVSKLNLVRMGLAFQVACQLNPV